MTTLLKYPGSKWRIANWIISHFPEHRVYCEPFFGSGAVFFNKKHVYTETINDIDGNIVNLFRVCREHPDKLAQLIEMTPFARDEFQACYEKSDDPIEQARRTIVRFHQSFGTSNSSKNSWKNTQTAGGPRCATMWNYLPNAIAECASALKEAQIENTDAVELIRRYNDKDTLIYCDPPYLQSIRRKNIYAYEMDEAKHIELLNVLKESKSKVVISGYDNELYNRELKGWSTDVKETTAQFGLHRIEKIWANFELDEQLKL
ncbi:MAG: DNA adenine methylase [Firmicutes bacterium]|nr:DNA adenine methylase [[Eubacterium] siraeum]MCM1486807.1 DNA adenine methylase [Bacillota bacterium]